MTEPGTLCCQQLSEEGRLLVLHADPRIWISAELLAELRREAHPDVTLIGDVLTVNAVNRRVVYRLGEYMREADCWLAEWPD